MDFVREWAEKTEIPQESFVGWIGAHRAQFFRWRHRYGKANEHNAHVPRDNWITEDERQRIIDFWTAHPLEGYRRLTFMMIDQDIVAVSPTTVYRVLSKEGFLDRSNRGPSKKGTGFEQPLAPHEHWHIDIAYLNVASTFYYLCSILDGASRSVVHWEIREAMTEVDVEVIVQRGLEKFPGVRPRIISDNGPQFIARDFKEFIRISGMTHVRTSPYYPQSNGKKERYFKTLKGEAVRPGAPSTLAEARQIVARFVDHYNNVRLHSALGYVTPADALAGRTAEIHEARDRKLEAARARRREMRAAAREQVA